MERYLPIGTIVNIKNNSKKIMIVGYFSIEYQNVVKIFDYVGCLYPEGMLLKNSLISFNHSDILDVVSMGYEDNDYNILNNNLNSQQDSEQEDLTSNPKFINLKFDANGVVIYDEVSDTKKDAQIIFNDTEVKNPFKEIKNLDTYQKRVKPKIENGFKFDINGNVIEDHTVIENLNDINSNFKYMFDENGVVISEEGVNQSENTKNSNVSYEFSENGIVTGERNLELPKEKDLSSHYVFDENGVVISE